MDSKFKIKKLTIIFQKYSFVLTVEKRIFPHYIFTAWRKRPKLNENAACGGDLRCSVLNSKLHKLNENVRFQGRSAKRKTERTMAGCVFVQRCQIPRVICKKKN